MKIMKTMLLACLLGGSAGTWAMEQKEEQKSQYDNSPRHDNFSQKQTTEIQKSKDGKNVTVFGRKTFYGFTAEELKAMPLVQALEKYDLDFTRIKRERVPEGTDLGTVVRFDRCGLSKVYNSNEIQKVVEKGSRVEAVFFGTKVLGYSEGTNLEYNFQVRQPLLVKSLDGRTKVLQDFFQESKYIDSYAINAYHNTNDLKERMLKGIIFKKFVPLLTLEMNDYRINPLFKSYNPDGETYEDRHRGKFPLFNLPVSPSIIKNFPPLPMERSTDMDHGQLNMWKDQIFLAKERGFSVEIDYFCSIFDAPNATAWEQCIMEDLKDVASMKLGNEEPKPLKILRIMFYVNPRKNSDFKGLISMYQRLHMFGGGDKNFTLTIYPSLGFSSRDDMVALRERMIKKHSLSNFIRTDWEYGRVHGLVLGNHRRKPMLYKLKVLDKTKVKNKYRKEVIAEIMRFTTF